MVIYHKLCWQRWQKLWGPHSSDSEDDSDNPYIPDEIDREVHNIPTGCTQSIQAQNILTLVIIQLHQQSTWTPNYTSSARRTQPHSFNLLNISLTSFQRIQIESKKPSGIIPSLLAHLHDSIRTARLAAFSSAPLPLIPTSTRPNTTPIPASGCTIVSFAHSYLNTAGPIITTITSSDTHPPLNPSNPNPNTTTLTPNLVPLVAQSASGPTTLDGNEV